MDADGRLWIGFDGGRGGEFDQGLQIYDPGKDEWENLSDELPNKGVQMIRAAGDRVLIGYPGGFSEYVNGEWRHTATGLAGVVRDADVDPYGNVFLATVQGLGIYRNGEQKALFTSQNVPFPENHVSAVRLIAPGRLLIGFWLHGGAVLTYDESLVTGSLAEDLPSDLKLHQNYPNPFNPATVLRFEVPGDLEVQLAVYDVLGRRVTTLVNERMEAGYHEAVFDASGLASGVYLYRLRAGEMMLTRKMMLVR